MCVQNVWRVVGVAKELLREKMTMTVEKLESEMRFFERKYGTITQCNVEIMKVRATLEVAYQLAVMNERMENARVPQD
jgi:hypothetical protein